MPKLQLTQQFVDNPPVVKLKTKTDYFDTRLTGFSWRSGPQARPPITRGIGTNTERIAR